MPPGPYDFVYVHTDIPEGMTIREWRTQRAAELATARREERAARRARLRATLRRPIIELARVTVAAGRLSPRLPRRAVGTS